MGKSLHARLVAYRPFGARIGVLAEPVSFSASMLHNDDGAISIEYSMLPATRRRSTESLPMASKWPWKCRTEPAIASRTTRVS